MSKTEAIHLPFVWKGFEYTPRCFEHPVVVIHGTTHLADEPHSVRDYDAIANSLILKRNQDGIDHLREWRASEHFIPWGIDAGYDICRISERHRYKYGSGFQMAQYGERICNCIFPAHQNSEIGIKKVIRVALNIGINKLPVAPQLVADLFDGSNGQAFG